MNKLSLAGLALITACNSEPSTRQVVDLPIPAGVTQVHARYVIETFADRRVVGSYGMSGFYRVTDYKKDGVVDTHQWAAGAPRRPAIQSKQLPATPSDQQLYDRVMAAAKQ